MEEVDGIIIHSLKTLGCDIAEEVTSLKDFTTELIVDATVRCLRLIKNDPNLSRSLPGGMSARFRVCTALANSITELGYTGELGYQSFLYSNDVDVRKLLIFLIEKIPRAATESTEETAGSSVLLYRSIASELAQRLSAPWVPPYLRHHSIVWRGHPPVWKREGVSDKYPLHVCRLDWPHRSADVTVPVPREVKKYQKTHLPIVSNQPVSQHDVAASILEDNDLSVMIQQTWDHEWNTLGLTSNLTKQQYQTKKREKVQKRVSDQLRAALQKCDMSAETPQSQNLNQILETMSNRTKITGKTKGSRFTHAEKLQFTQDEKEVVVTQIPVAEEPGKTEQQTQEELQQQRESELENLRGQLDTIATKMDRLELANKKYTTQRQQMEDNIGEETRKNEEKKEEVRVKRRTVDLLPNAEENIDKLQQIVDNTSKRLTSLAEQWETHRGPLIGQYRELKQLNSLRVSESQKKLEEIREFREKMKDLADETRNKDDLHKQLVSEYERMTKDVNRSAYTRKIMEIVANIKKQKEEINKVLLDTRTAQKEINSLQGKLGRTFTVADELIFKDAKKDEAVKRAYKYLAALHENCDQLIDTVEETGVIMREIRDLEQQIEQESSKKIASTLKRITEDLQQMKNENASLLNKVNIT